MKIQETAIKPFQKHPIVQVLEDKTTTFAEKIQNINLAILKGASLSDTDGVSNLLHKLVLRDKCDRNLSKERKQETHDLIEYFIENCPQLLGAPNAYGMSAFELAVYHGNFTIAEQLLEKLKNSDAMLVHRVRLLLEHVAIKPESDFIKKLENRLSQSTLIPVIKRHFKDAITNKDMALLKPLNPFATTKISVNEDGSEHLEFALKSLMYLTPHIIDDLLDGHSDDNIIVSSIKFWMQDRQAEIDSLYDTYILTNDVQGLNQALSAKKYWLCSLGVMHTDIIQKMINNNIQNIVLYDALLKNGARANIIGMYDSNIKNAKTTIQLAIENDREDILKLLLKKKGKINVTAQHNVSMIRYYINELQENPVKWPLIINYFEMMLRNSLDLLDEGQNIFEAPLYKRPNGTLFFIGQNDVLKLLDAAFQSKNFSLKDALKDIHSKYKPYLIKYLEEHPELAVDYICNDLGFFRQNKELYKQLLSSLATFASQTQNYELIRPLVDDSEVGLFLEFPISISELVKFGFSESVVLNTAFEQAYHANNLAKMKKCFSYPSAINIIDLDIQQEALIDVCEAKNDAMVTVFMNYGVDPNFTLGNRSPLYEALYSYHIPTLTALRPKINLGQHRSILYPAFLHICSIKGSLDLVLLLLNDYKVNPEFVDVVTNKTPIRVALESGTHNVLSYLLSLKMDLDIYGDLDALKRACIKANNSAQIFTICSAGIDPNFKLKGTTPLIEALKNRDSLVLSVMLPKITRTSSVITNLQKALFAEVSSSDPKILDVLLSNGVSPCFELGQYPRTPYLNALLQGNVKAVKSLLPYSLCYEYKRGYMVLDSAVRDVINKYLEFERKFKLALIDTEEDADKLQDKSVANTDQFIRQNLVLKLNANATKIDLLLKKMNQERNVIDNIVSSALTSFGPSDYIYAIFTSKSRAEGSVCVDALVINYFIMLPEYQALVKDAL